MSPPRDPHDQIQETLGVEPARPDPHASTRENGVRHGVCCGQVATDPAMIPVRRKTRR